MKQLCVLFFLSTAVSGCVVQDTYYVNEGSYYTPPPVVVDNNTEVVHQHYYHGRYRRPVAPNVHGHPSTQEPAVVVPKLHGHPNANVHGHPDVAVPRSNVHGHPSRVNTSEIVVSSP